MNKITIQLINIWLVGAALLIASSVGHAAVYYLNPVLGNDANSGTSPQAPFRTLERADKLTLHAGDQVLLAAGKKFRGELAYENLTGTVANPIVISSYQADGAIAGGRALIDAKGFAAGVSLRNCSHVQIANLSISANAGGMMSEKTASPGSRYGVVITVDRPGNFSGFALTNLIVRDVFYEAPGFVRSPEETKSANGTQNYGWGIRFINSSADATMRDISVSDCQIQNVSHTGLKLTAPSNGLQGVSVQRVWIAGTGGPGVQMSGVNGGHFSELDVNHSGSHDDSRKWGRGSGLWTWGTSNVIIEKSRFQDANGPGDSAGVHIDYNCRNVIVQYNLSMHNAGGFCEILGNNYNCAYRYNVSVNDGYRIKGRNGAFQEGKIFWLSGFMGDKSELKGPFNTYFYNNTIYVGENLTAKVAITPTARGVLIANNIFYIKGSSEVVVGDQKRTDATRAKIPLKNIVFENNLYLSPDNWPKASIIQDAAPSFGDPEFKNAGGDKLLDYIPSNHYLVKNRGIPIPKIPFDDFGLTGGLVMQHDILGQPITGRPDLGAVEMIQDTQQAELK